MVPFALILRELENWRAFAAKLPPVMPRLALN